MRGVLLLAAALVLLGAPALATGSRPVTVPVAAGEDTLTIVERGATEYRIAIPADAEAPLPYAARELQHFLHQMSGITLPIVSEGTEDGPALRLGAPDEAGLEGLGEDGVLIRTDGRDVLLTGKDPRGRLYAVYAFLERFLGVRFLAHDCTVVPKREVLAVPRIDYRHTPPFMYRETLYFDSFPKAVATRQRLNGPTTLCDEEVGGKIAFYPYVHSFCKLVPPEEYFEEHPEYFSLVDGKRTNATVHGQLCLTNPDVLSIAKEQVLRWIDEHPEVPIIDVSQNDGGGACQCDRCRAVVEEEGSEHGPILRFVNSIADVVAEQHPDKWVETLAYAYSTKPPALERPRPNVIIRLCHAGCYFHGFERCGLGANLITYLQEWSKLTKRIFVWHYATNFAHYLAPNQNLKGLADDIRYYAAHGVNGLMIQGDYQSPGGELAELRQYLAAQLMWDPQRDPAILRLEFCNGYYGPAADDVLEYLALMDRAAADPGVHAFGAWDPQDSVTPEFVSEGLAILTRARSRADGPEIANHVSKLLLPLWYMQLAYPDRYGLAKADAVHTVNEFRRVAEANHVTHVREGDTQIEGWLAEMEARYGALPDAVLYDLYLNMNQAACEHCLDWRGNSVERNGKAVLSIFLHPPPPDQGHATATYQVDLPECDEATRLRLCFATAFTGPTDDGAAFAIRIDGHEVWQRTQQEVAPLDHELDLSPWAGRSVALTLDVHALGNETHDWANWLRPQIVRANEPPNR